MHTGSLVITDPQAVPTYGEGPIFALVPEESRRAARRSLRPPHAESRRDSDRGDERALARDSLRPGPGLDPDGRLLRAVGLPRAAGHLDAPLHDASAVHPAAKWLDRAHPYVMSFLFGMPTGYREHHMGCTTSRTTWARISPPRFATDATASSTSSSTSAASSSSSSIELPLYLCREEALQARAPGAPRRDCPVHAHTSFRS